MFVSNSICIKPNLLLKRTPEEATTTHPVVVRAVVETLLSYGVKAQNMVIADSPWGFVHPKPFKGHLCGQRLTAGKRANRRCAEYGYRLPNNAKPQGAGGQGFFHHQPHSKGGYGDFGGKTEKPLHDRAFGRGEKPVWLCAGAFKAGIAQPFPQAGAVLPHAAGFMRSWCARLLPWWTRLLPWRATAPAGAALSRQA